MKTILTLPQSAVDKDYQYIVPTLNFKEGGKDNIIDWYSALHPENPAAEGSPVPGVTWKSERIESAETGEAESYRIEIVSNQTAENPMEITFADGYTMTMFADTAESGNGVGVIVLDNIYKTNRASLGQLVNTITTGEDGKAVSKLLPLGKYIIREVSAPNGYVKDDTGYEVELSYKDRFTPLVWAGANLENRFFTAEIDLEKVFETTFESGQYAESGGAAREGELRSSGFAGDGSSGRAFKGAEGRKDHAERGIPHGHHQDGRQGESLKPYQASVWRLLYQRTCDKAGVSSQ